MEKRMNIMKHPFAMVKQAREVFMHRK